MKNVEKARRLMKQLEQHEQRTLFTDLVFAEKLIAAALEEAAAEQGAGEGS